MKDLVLLIILNICVFYMQPIHLNSDTKICTFDLLVLSFVLHCYMILEILCMFIFCDLTLCSTCIRSYSSPLFTSVELMAELKISPSYIVTLYNIPVYFLAFFKFYLQIMLARLRANRRLCFFRPRKLFLTPCCFH